MEKRRCQKVNNLEGQQDDESDYFNSSELNIEIENEKVIGKRTGRLYKSKNWKKNSGSFYEIDDQQQDSFTPDGKIKKLRQLLGLQVEQKYSNSNQQQQIEVSEEQLSQNKNRLIRNNKQFNGSKVKKKREQKLEQNNKKQNLKERRITRKTIFSLSFSLDDINLDLIDNSSHTTSTQYQEINISYEKSNAISDEKSNAIAGEQSNAIFKEKSNAIAGEQSNEIAGQKSKAEVKQKNYLQKNDKNNLIGQQKQQSVLEIKKNRTTNSSPKIQKEKFTHQIEQKINDSKNSEQIIMQKNRFVLKNTQQEKKQFELKKKQEFQEFHFQQKNELKNKLINQQYLNCNFSQIKCNLSQIKHIPNENQDSLQNDPYFHSLLQDLGNPSCSETGQLNRAVINNQTQNTKDQFKLKQKDHLLINNPKVPQKNIKSIKQITSNSNQHLSPFNSKLEQQNQSQKQTNPNSKKQKKDNYFLTDSLRKQAQYYHQNQIKQARQKHKALIILQKNTKKQAKRQRSSDNINMKEILDQQELQKLKQKGQLKKALKKIKKSQPQLIKQKAINNKKKVNIDKSKERLNDNSKERLNDKSKDKRQKASTNRSQNFKQILQKNSKQSKITEQQQQKQQNMNEEDETNFSVVKKKQQEIKINNRLVKQTDMKLKSKKRPQRVSPTNKRNKSKPQSINITGKLNSQKSIKLSKAKTQISEFNTRNNSIQIDPELNTGRKYPKRHRLGRIQGWNGEKIVYDSQGNVIGLQSKQLIRLIGFRNETNLESETTKSNQDILNQNILIEPGQIVQFQGFDHRFRELHIIYIRKSQNNYSKSWKSVQVDQNGEVTFLLKPRIIQPETGAFVIRNVSQTDSAYLQLVLFKNQFTQI